MIVNKSLVKLSRNIHVCLSIVLLFLLIFFSITGVTLNHPSWGGTVKESSKVFQLTETLPIKDSALLLQSKSFRRLIRQEFWVDLRFAKIENDGGILVVDAQNPGRATLMEIDLTSGEIQSYTTNYGWIAFFNDLHKGRHTQTLWRALIDVSAALVVIFSITGLILLLPNRKMIKKVSALTLIGVSLCIGAYWAVY